MLQGKASVCGLRGRVHVGRDGRHGIILRGADTGPSSQQVGRGGVPGLHKAVELLLQRSKGGLDLGEMAGQLLRHLLQLGVQTQEQLAGPVALVADALGNFTPQGRQDLLMQFRAKLVDLLKALTIQSYFGIK